MARSLATFHGNTTGRSEGDLGAKKDFPCDKRKPVVQSVIADTVTWVQRRNDCPPNRTSPGRPIQCKP
jgi:hypothetical protein